MPFISPQYHDTSSPQMFREQILQSNVVTSHVPGLMAQKTDFRCPEEFGYYPHPGDCRLASHNTHNCMEFSWNLCNLVFSTSLPWQLSFKVASYNLVFQPLLCLRLWRPTSWILHWRPGIQVHIKHTIQSIVINVYPSAKTCRPVIGQEMFLVISREISTMPRQKLKTSISQ